MAHLIKRRLAADEPVNAVHYARTVGPSLGIETIGLDELKLRASAEQLQGMQRLHFWQFLLYSAGRGEHLIDFTPYPVKAHTLIIVRPGMLQQFRLNDTLAGQLLIVEPQFMLPDRLAQLSQVPFAGLWPACLQLDRTQAGDLLEICTQLRRDELRTTSFNTLSALAHQRLNTWLLLLGIATEKIGQSPLPDPNTLTIVRNFQTLVDQYFAQHWTVQDYARKLGYAERTITRACHTYIGKSAKTCIDERLVLEVKRLLAHTTYSLESIGSMLGFSESSQLCRIFKRIVNNTPQGFRKSLTL